MAFDQKTRNLLQRTVTACRRILDREFTAQCQELYGIQPSGVLSPLSALDHLGDEELQVARLLRERLNHLEGGVAENAATLTQVKPEHVARVIREQAFTVLNRLAALRLCEERGLVLECVRKAFDSEGFQLFLNSAGNALGERHEAYAIYLHCLFDELAIDLGILFDRFSPLGLLFPRKDALAEVLKELNGSGKAAEREEITPEQFAEIWKADETIGWIYQYYNDEAERKKMRDESAAPRNSRELAVRNQFFTPRYVVEFLTDNTLGRLWYEMTQGQTRLKEQCRYLVRRPDEVFLGHMTHEPGEHFAAGSGRAAQELTSGTEENYPPYNRSEPQRMIDLAHAVNGYARRTYGEWFESALQQGRNCRLHQMSTQDILDWLFLECRSDRAGGDGSIYSESWFVNACNEVRRRALRSREPNLSQEELLKQPVFIPFRPLKDPREILMLDPACGSMHFGLYAFDLFQTIYAEAWDHHPELLKDLRAELNSPSPPSEGGEGRGEVGNSPSDARRAFLRLVPRLIIEHNIHGIDIDPRCAQIAGLSLWLRAQRAWEDIGLAPAQRPQIKRSNIVCAEPMPGEKELLKEFVEREFPPQQRSLYQALLETIFDRMQLAGEAGSLLKIEEEIRSAITQARHLWEERRQEFFDPAELTNLSRRAGTQRELAMLQDRDSTLKLTDDAFWEQLEESIYTALRDYAEQAENGGGFQRRLFAEDAARGFAFIDLCRKRYDVVVMNPPFGEQTEALKAYLAKQYARTKNNLYCAFVERAYGYCPAGIVGLISARTFVMYRDFEGFREEFLLNSARIQAFADLGWEVLDGAQVETAAFVLGRGVAATGVDNCLVGPFIKLLTVGPDQKREMLLRTCNDPTASKDVFFVRRDQLSALPGSPLAYWASRKLVKLFSESATFEPALARCGRGAAAHAFFFRLGWEIPSDQSTELNWRRLAHGGEYSPFFRENSVFIYWKDSGREVKEYILKQYPYLNGNFGWAIQDEDKYGIVGLTSGKRNERFNVQLMPAGHIFTNEGQGFIPNQTEDVWFCLGYLNSSLVSYFLALTSGLQKTWVYIRPVPVVCLDSTTRRTVEAAARESFELKRNWTAGAEESAWFLRPWALSDVATGPIAHGVRKLLQRHVDASEAINQRRTNLSKAILTALQLDPNDEAEVISDFQRHPTDVALPQWRDTKEVEILREYATRITSYLVGGTFGRWDIRHATGERPAPELPDPFAPLPVCPPGMLQGDDGLPLSPEAGRRLRAEGRYPLDVAWDGILVDDPEHPLDIERNVHAALQVIGGERTDAIEHEACDLLDVRSLRDWFRKPTGFFADHLKRYSKSRRQAPIYWPLSTATGSYTLWIYYHRLTPDTLFKCVQQFVNPKLADVEKEITHLRTVLAANEGGTKERKRLEELEDLRRELLEMRTELEQWAPKWKPNLNDGVLITASPLWKLFRLPKWRKDLEACWKELERGDYDWAHLALTLWPDRVREKCKTDRSLAIAHGLEDLCDVRAPEKKAKKAKKSKDDAALEIEKQRDALRDEMVDALSALWLGEKLPSEIVNSTNGEIIVPANRKITKTLLRKIAISWHSIEIAPGPMRGAFENVLKSFKPRFEVLLQSSQPSLALQENA